MTTKKSKKIVIGYIRKSKEDKKAKAVSPESQRASGAQYAKARGCDYVYFEDINKHGDNLNRPGYKDMVAFIKENYSKQKLLGKLDIDEVTYKELMKKWQKEKDEISCRITNISATSKDTMTRMDILIDFANRIPELYLKANTDEKRIIIGTLTDSIMLDIDANKIIIKLKPIFEYLRQLKLQKKEPFSADFENLNRTLETRTNKERQTNENCQINLDKEMVSRTREKLLNTKIEPHFEALNELNVEDGT